MSIVTWKKNSFEVIDYESNNLINSFFEINEPGFIFRKNDEIIKTKEILENDIEKLFEILLDENFNYELKFNNFDFDQNGIIRTINSAWFALIKNKMDDEIDLNRYELKEGEIIRIGKLFFRTKKIKIQKYENNIANTNNSNNINYINTTTSYNVTNNLNFNGNLSINTEINVQDVQVNSDIYKKKSKFLNLKANFNKSKIEEKKKDLFCRICYEEEDKEDNPLLQPCNCHGSMKYIHLNCLKQWLKTNTFIIYDNNELCKTIKFKEAKCELCQEKLPDFLQHKGKLYEIIDYGIDFKNYIIFDCLTLDKNNNKYMYIISLDNINNNKLLSIGRGKDCCLVLSDSSISRNHCALRYNNKKLFLEDCGSKFGTLILCHIGKIKLTEGIKLYLQIGRSFIKCNLKKSYSFFGGCCNISETKNFDFYYKQNEIKFEDFYKKTIKTEIDSENYEDEKNEKLIEEFDIENKDNINGRNENQLKLMDGNNLVTEFNIYGPTVKLNVISECIDENNNEMNKSENNQNKGELSEERKND